MSNLPDGATLMTPEARVIGGWREMVYDAQVVRYGVTWLRVKDGMGGRGDREDWVAVLPGVAVCVHDYHWNGESFGANHGSFDNACRQELRRESEWLPGRLAKAREQLAALETAEAAIAKALVSA